MHPDDVRMGDSGTGPVKLRWLGTAGYELTCEGTTLLIDPYFTRVGMRWLLRGVARPDEARLERELPHADGVVVGHSHFDHVMDVPSIARRTGATVYGSQSTWNLCRAAGLPEDQLVACSGGETFEVGPFRVTMVRSEHSRFAFGRIPYQGDIPCTCELPLELSGYRCGQVFGISITVGDTRLYHMGSAELIDDAVPPEARDVDVFLMGISGRHHTERYVPRAIRALSPGLVVPMHYDNFFRSYDAPMRLLPLTRFARFVDEVRGVDPHAAINTLGFGGVMYLGSGAGPEV